MAIDQSFTFRITALAGASATDTISVAVTDIRTVDIADAFITTIAATTPPALVYTVVPPPSTDALLSSLTVQGRTVALDGSGNGTINLVADDGIPLTFTPTLPDDASFTSITLTNDAGSTVAFATSATAAADFAALTNVSESGGTYTVDDSGTHAISVGNNSLILTVQAEDSTIPPITHIIGITVPGPASAVDGITVSPADMSISEERGRASIVVRLDNPVRTGDSAETVTFTLGGDAVRGDTADYVIDTDASDCPDPCTTLALTFAAPAQEQTIVIEARPDDDEDDETLTFTIPATGNSLVSADISVDITISEVTVEMEEVKTEVETLATLIGAEQVGTISGLIRSRFSAQASSGVASLDTPSSVLAGGTTKLSLHHNPRTLGDMLDGLALEHSASADGGGAYAVWVRGQYSSMEGDPTVNGITVDYDGDSTGLGIGAEKNTGSYVAGVAVNWLTTDLDISSSSDNTTISKYEESLVMVAPYLSLRRGARTFWFSGGYGIGDADATLEENEGKASADVEVSFASAGADFVLSERGKNRIIGGLSVLGMRKVVDPLNFAAADVVIPKITLNTFRAQGEITYSRTIEAGAGRVVRPYIGVATLHDAGDRVNDDSHAMDLRGGVDFDGTQFDVSLEASTELLREDHESWSVSGSARYQFAPGGRGASLALDGIGGEASDIGLEGGYGMMMRQVHRDALLTPFAGIRHGSESGEFSSGMRLAIGGDMDADLRAARAFGNDEDTLKLNFRRTF